MITLKPIIVPSNRRQDGTWPVVIRLTFQGKSRRIATPLVCTPQDLSRSLHIRTNSPVMEQAQDIVKRMREAVAGIDPCELASRDVDWVAARIRSYFSRKSFVLDFLAWGNKFIQSKEKTTRRAYSAALAALSRFVGKNTLDISELTKPLLLDFMASVDDEPRLWYDRRAGRLVPSSVGKIPRAASTRHLAKLEHIYNAARDRFNDEDSGVINIPRNPFKGIRKYYPLSRGQTSIGVEGMQRVINARTDDRCVRLSLDVFLLSFVLMGVNLADLWDARPFEGEWRYNRRKTKNRRADRAEMRVTIPEQARPYLARLTGAGEWWLNRLHSFTGGGKDYATARINRYIKRWCESEGVEPFTFGAARHTWATLARAQGVDKSTIDDCLAHKGDYSVTDIYAEKAWHLMTEANEKVLSLFAWVGA